MLNLLRPTKSGSLSFQNRVFMAPLTRNRADNPAALPTQLHVEYYRQRAGAGLIISEGLPVSPRGVGYVHIPGIWSERQVEAWQPVTRAVHGAGGRIFAQLWHVGRVSHPDFHDGELPLAPSALNPYRPIKTIQRGRTVTVTPKAMSSEEIQSTIHEFQQAGINALAAGFDGVEVHSSNGYLFHQFFSPSSNHRTDRYGGSVENRIRFLFEVLDALGDKIPIGCVGLRLNPMLQEERGIQVTADTVPTFEAIVDRLNDFPLAYLHLTRALRHLDTKHFLPDVIGHFRSRYSGFLIANGNYDPREAEEEIEQGRADAVAFGRLFISNPDLPLRISRKGPYAEADPDTFYTQGPKGYTDYPTLPE